MDIQSLRAGFCGREGGGGEVMLQRGYKTIDYGGRGL